MIKGYDIKLIISDSGNVFGYFDRHTLEGRGEYNFGKGKAHYIEFIGKQTEDNVLNLKRKIGQANFIKMFTPKLKKWIFEKVLELEKDSMTTSLKD